MDEILRDLYSDGVSSLTVLVTRSLVYTLERGSELGSYSHSEPPLIRSKFCNCVGLLHSLSFFLFSPVISWFFFYSRTLRS